MDQFVLVCVCNIHDGIYRPDCVGITMYNARDRKKVMFSNEIFADSVHHINISAEIKQEETI